MIVADTHAWIWWMSGSPKLSPRARRELEAAYEVGICEISCWEVATLAARQRIGLDREPLTWIKQALASARVELLPISPEIAVEAARLPKSFPGDPADRLIVASAMQHRATLVTKDRQIRASKLVRAVW
jgi:PIN domain nuclease of toxin-antitoxin system